jgi:hypothetical protein
MYSGASKERLPTSAKSPARAFRYRYANKFITKDDFVLELGCGSRYGRQNLICSKYLGVDVSNLAHPDIIVDLNTWQADFPFDVLVSFEVIEHVKNTKNFVEITKRAKREIIISCPATETLSFNSFHIYDFTPARIKELFEDETWVLAECIIRPVRYGKQQINRFIRR